MWLDNMPTCKAFCVVICVLSYNMQTINALKFDMTMPYKCVENWDMENWDTRDQRSRVLALPRSSKGMSLSISSTTPLRLSVGSPGEEWGEGGGAMNVFNNSISKLLIVSINQPPPPPPPPQPRVTLLKRRHQRSLAATRCKDLNLRRSTYASTVCVMLVALCVRRSECCAAMSCVRMPNIDWYAISSTKMHLIIFPLKATVCS